MSRSIKVDEEISKKIKKVAESGKAVWLQLDTGEKFLIVKVGSLKELADT